MNDQPPADVIRTFICIDLPESIKEQIAELQNELRRIDAQVSWVKPANIHLTLKFLGDIPQARIPAAVEAARRAIGSCSLFEVEVKGTGCFPSAHRPSVLWVGLGQLPEALTKLHQGIESELSRQGFPRETKKFKPHLTIGRVRNPRNAREMVGALIERGFTPQRFLATEIIVMRSELDPRGAIYTPQAVLPLAS